MQATDTALLEKLNKSLEKQNQIARQALDLQNQKYRFYRLLIAWGIFAGCQVYLTLFSPKASLVDRVLGTDFSVPVQSGDKIAGYEVTSGFGNRQHPTKGGVRHHDGVDVATPTGTRLYFPVDSGKVECKMNAGGYGLYAIITPDNAAVPYSFLAGHLTNCAAGNWKFGQVFAATGGDPGDQPNAGTSTGAHLHWEQLKGDEPMNPTKGWLVQLLTGNRVTEEMTMTSGDKITRLRRAIIGQESGGNFTAINPDSGAMGYGQLMPENVTAWSQEILGHAVSHEEFLANPDIQLKIIDGKLQKYWQQEERKASNEAEIIRRVASLWYSGDPDLFDNTAPQYYGGGSYPSINDYTLSVLGKYQAIE